ncbi:MFS allantoate transporter [Penicillium angulare]|uniref:MFS allantoate transporter n=1 Tax=Penicillium angulare TaxID=116970 RepID=UPI002541C7B8|nr:MFS allantoate transporter [Penicillium angulare]KAJ5260518.1 MFS allantoate transporter [Penicillium angulare]
MWYTRREQPIRIGLWYSSLGLGIAGGGLLGYGIGQIKGSLPSWKYEFIIIGALCITWGIVMLIVLPDSPVSAPLLTVDQRKLAVERLRENQTGIENRNFKRYQLIEAFTDVKVLCFFLIALLQAIVNGGITNFGTLIVKGFGYTTSFGLRFVPSSAKVGRLICYYLTGSYNASFVMLLSLTTANIAGHTKKVTSSACLFVGYCVGNIAGPFFYKSDQAPGYSLGIWSMIVSHLLEVIVVIVLWIILKRENQRRDDLQSSTSSAHGDKTSFDADLAAFSDITDKENSNFRYVY